MEQPEREARILLHRIGRAPNPLSPPPGGRKNSGNRFDDPLGEFWVMYAAEQRRACFIETLAAYRADLTLLTALQAAAGEPEDDVLRAAGIIPDDWHLKRMVARFRLAAAASWLDLRLVDVREHLRRTLSQTFVEFGHDDFDMSDALSRDRRLTQAIARWAYDQGYQGIIYPSRLDPTYNCWAIFEGTRIELIDVAPIRRDDPDLVAVARLFGLRRGDESH